MDPPLSRHFGYEHSKGFLSFAVSASLYRDTAPCSGEKKQCAEEPFHTVQKLAVIYSVCARKTLYSTNPPYRVPASNRRFLLESVPSYKDRPSLPKSPHDPEWRCE